MMLDVFYAVVDEAYHNYRLAIENIEESVCSYTRLHRFSPKCEISHKSKERLIFEYSCEAYLLWSVIDNLMTTAECFSNPENLAEIKRRNAKYERIIVNYSQLDDLNDLTEINGASTPPPEAIQWERPRYKK
jgi:hypothetical protein